MDQVAGFQCHLFALLPLDGLWPYPHFFFSSFGYLWKSFSLPYIVTIPKIKKTNTLYFSKSQLIKHGSTFGKGSLNHQERIFRGMATMIPYDSLDCINMAATIIFH